MQKALNVKNFRTFAQQVKGAQVGVITYERTGTAKGPRLKLFARCPKTRRIFNGEWVLGDDTADQDEKDFVALAEKEFAVRRVGAGE